VNRVVVGNASTSSAQSRCGGTGVKHGGTGLEGGERGVFTDAGGVIGDAGRVYHTSGGETARSLGFWGEQGCWGRIGVGQGGVGRLLDRC
jgi:hypothetical protein